MSVRIWYWFNFRLVTYFAFDPSSLPPSILRRFLGWGVWTNVHSSPREWHIIQFSVFSGMIHRLFRRRQASQGLSLRVQPLPEPGPTGCLVAAIGISLLLLPWLLTGKCGVVGMVVTSPCGHSRSKGKLEVQGMISWWLRCVRWQVTCIDKDDASGAWLHRWLSFRGSYSHSHLHHFSYHRNNTRMHFQAVRAVNDLC